MTEQKNQSGSLLARAIGLQVIAGIQLVAAISLVGLVVAYLVAQRNPNDLLWWVDESLFWVFPAILLLTIGRGLWNRRPWARVLALIIHWPIFVGAIGLLPLCLGFLLLVPARGIAVGHVFALFGLVAVAPVFLVSGWTLWYLHRRTLR